MSKVYKDNVIANLKDLASYDFQKQAWFAASGPIVSSFTEDVCSLFDDTGLSDAFKNNQIIFGLETDQCLRELHIEIDKVNENANPRVILDDPQMQKVREKATEALKLINNSQG